MALGIPLGPYRLTRRLATGGMAEIFLARREGKEGFARDLVVKRILPHLAADPEFRRMFREEARLAAVLSHPNVVHVYDFGSIESAEGDQLYLAMELVRGVDLRALIGRAAEQARVHGRPWAVPAHHAAKICSFVCEALAHAHAVKIDGKPAGIVHRDVTPSNVLVSFEGAVKLADFGIAKAAVTTERGTDHGVVKGKHSYLSPEQARGQPLDARSDIFNVGILLFESLTGEPLFPQGDPRQAKRLSAEGQIPRPERLARLPPALGAIVRKALSPRRDDRYPDALAMRAELEAWLREGTVPSDTVELGRFVRELFPDALAEDARGARAAGTVPATAALLTQETALLGKRGPDGTAVSALVEAPTTVEPLRQLTAVTTPLSIAGSATPVLERPEGGLSQGRALGYGAAIVLVASTIGAFLAIRANDAPGPPPAEAPSAPPAAPPRAEGPPAPPRPAELRVTTIPAGLRVFVDDADRGVAPLTLALAPGDAHRIEARDEDGDVRASRAIALLSGEIAEMALEAAPEHATLRVASMPSGARVELDGMAVGATPLELPVAPGVHRVGLSLEGHEPMEEEVSIAAAGDTASVAVSLEESDARTGGTRPRGGSGGGGTRARGVLVIATNPWSEVFEGSRRLGVTPLRVELPAGRHTLRLRSPGHADRTHVVEVTEGEPTRVRLEL